MGRESIDFMVMEWWHEIGSAIMNMPLSRSVMKL